MKIFKIQKLNDEKIKEQHRVNISNSFCISALENLGVIMDINWAQQSTGKNIEPNESR